MAVSTIIPCQPCQDQPPPRTLLCSGPRQERAHMKAQHRQKAVTLISCSHLQYVGLLYYTFFFSA